MKTKLYVKPESITCEDIRVISVAHDIAGDIFLISPDKGKHKWKQSELHLRSLLIRKNGEILCSGFPKFRNLGEDEDDDAITKKLITNSKVLFTEKMDGSLIIRSVIDGVVCFRTRGHHNLGDYKEAVMKLISEEYSKLMDPSYKDNSSMLFEYTSPDNRIILHYKHSSLTYLGEMCFEPSFDFPVFRSGKENVSSVSKETMVPGVKFHDLSGDSNQISSEVFSWLDSEGIVIWGVKSDGTIHLSKIKAFEYRKLHSLRFQLSGKKIKKLCWFYKIETQSALEEKLYSFGADWEFYDLVREGFEEYILRLNQRRREVKSIIDFIDEAGVLQISRKEQAILLKEKYDKPDFIIAMQYCIGGLECLEDLIYSYALEVSPNSLKILRESLGKSYMEYGL